ncbi:outer membrane protein assembly factor BamA [Caulobacter sp. 17J80-11]|uniref:outer membrane protein assembly factor BamA n=1 Tax=Caulobacter sp. 17J80-11 TaxID=2763502 RepID=UPI00351C7388
MVETMSDKPIRNSCLVLASGLAILAASPAMAQDQLQGQPANPEPAPAPAPESGVVARIVVQGNERIDQQTILSYLPIQPGDTVDAARIDLAVKTLFRTDLFADVEIGLQGSDLMVRVVENPIINQVVFEGNESLAEDKMRDEVGVRPRGIFTRSRVQQDVQRIVELYRRSGRISATVTPKIVELPQKRVDLIFEIDEGPKTGVRRINFLGNKAFSDNDLRDVLVTKESQWWRVLSSNTNYDPDRLEYDREQLRKFYTNRGFYDFRVVSGVAELSPDRKDFAITVTVDEGPKYTFGNLKVETENQKLEPEFLQALLPIKSGQLYESDKIEDAVDALTYAAGSAGFAFVDVRPRYQPNREKQTVDVTFQVREGPRVYVERIDIVGNTRTIDPVIRREMQLVEGDAYNKILLERSRNEIRRLGFFKDVKIDEQPGSAPDKTVIQVQVEEQPTGELSFGAGFSSVDQFIFDLGVTERNFRGRGQNLRARLSLGSLRQTLDFAFTEPKFLGRDLRAGVDLYAYRYDFGDQASFDTKTAGMGLRLGFPINSYTYLATRYNLRNDEIVVDDSLCTAASSSSSLCQQRGTFLTSLVGYTLSVDRRNDPIAPTRGWYANLRQDLAGIGGDVNYLKSEVEGGMFYGIRPKWVVSALGSAGYISGWSGDNIRINDRFFKGGNSFRGFETAGIGPRDTSTTDALGGDLYAIGTLEMAFPLPLPEEYGISAGLFTEFGTLGMLDDVYKLNANGTPNPFIRDDLSLRASAGLTIRWKSPMGPIQFDLSQILAREDYDKTETFRFSTSTRF